jgi:hypothetical protein
MLFSADVVRRLPNTSTEIGGPMKTAQRELALEDINAG